LSTKEELVDSNFLVELRFPHKGECMSEKLTFGGPLAGFTQRGGASRPVIPVTGPLGFSAYIYQCWLNVDYDGAHRAYGLNRDGAGFPLQKNLKPLESPPNGSLNNARRGTTGDWVGLEAMTRNEALATLRGHYPGFTGMKADKQQEILSQFWDNRTSSPMGSLEGVRGNGRFPIVQLPEMKQPRPGYYVSLSHAYDKSNRNEWDQNRYLDAGEVPYAVLLKLPGARLGDFGIAIRNRTGQSTAFLFGDTGADGGSTRLGECSANVYFTIANGQISAVSETYSFIVFPGSGSGSADAKAVENMVSRVRNEMGKTALTGDKLARKFAPAGPEFETIGRAIWEWGGPEIGKMHPRSHGGPETAHEDFAD